MIRVAIASAFQNKPENKKRLRFYLKYAFDKGVAPFASHGLYPGALDDSNAEQRRRGMEAGKAFIKTCQEMWVFVVDGIITDGMEEEIRFAIANNIPIKWFCADDPKKPTELMHLGEHDLPTKRQLAPVTEKGAQEVCKGFGNIAKMLEQGADYQSYEKELDILLGTGLSDRDEEAEEIYERGHREKEET